MTRGTPPGSGKGRKLQDSGQPQGPLFRVVAAAKLRSQMQRNVTDRHPTNAALSVRDIWCAKSDSTDACHGGRHQTSYERPNRYTCSVANTSHAYLADQDAPSIRRLGQVLFLKAKPAASRSMKSIPGGSRPAKIAQARYPKAACKISTPRCAMQAKTLAKVIHEPPEPWKVSMKNQKEDEGGRAYISAFAGLCGEKGGGYLFEAVCDRAALPDNGQANDGDRVCRDQSRASC